MYKRTEELKVLLSKIPSFENAIYDDGILKDLRFVFLYQSETFLLHYKFDYSKPHLYHKKRDNTLTQVKDFIIPTTIKREMESITTILQQFNQAYYPLIPNQQKTLGVLTYESKYLNEYAPANKEIDYLSVTYDVEEKGEIVAEVDLAFKKTKSEWITDKVEINNRSNGGTGIELNVCLFEDTLLEMLNGFMKESKKDELLKAADYFLKGTE